MSNKFSSGTDKAERLQHGEGEAMTGERRRAPGFAGWLAAVIVLGLAVIVLGTMLALGLKNYDGAQTARADEASHSLYELNALVDNLDANLSKARIASSAGDRARIFSDIAVESELAESAIERLPVAGELTRSMTSFINKVGQSAQDMLVTVAEGGDLSSSQLASIEYMYGCNRQLKQFLNDICTDCSRDDMMGALKGEGKLFDDFGGYTDPAADVPKEIHDGPFAENTEGGEALALKGEEEITPARAEELIRQYFKEYKVKSVRCTGEAVSGRLTCYNVEAETEKGDIFAQLSKQGGKLVMFDSHKDCRQDNFSDENCIRIAEKFLNDAGYAGMKPVWVSSGGAVCNLNFVCEQDGAVIYPDMIKVKVCRERGMVTGMEALAYLLNHTQRTLPAAKLTKGDILSSLGGYEADSIRLALIPEEGGTERLAYECFIRYKGSEYYVYFDASSGKECGIFTVVNSARGRNLL